MHKITEVDIDEILLQARTQLLFMISSSEKVYDKRIGGLKIIQNREEEYFDITITGYYEDIPMEEFIEESIITNEGS